MLGGAALYTAPLNNWRLKKKKKKRKERKKKKKKIEKKIRGKNEEQRTTL